MKLFLRLMVLALLVAAGGSTRGAAVDAPWIGLVATYAEDAKTAEGRLTVVKVYSESPAAKAGLRVDDVIHRVNGVTFRFPDWTATVANGGPFAWAKVGDRLRLAVTREGRAETVEIVAAAPPPEIVEERRKFQASLVERRGPQVFDALVRRGAVIQVERQGVGGPLAAQAEGVSAEEAAALSSFIETSRLRVLFTKVEPGQPKRFQLALDPATGETKIDPIP